MEEIVRTARRLAYDCAAMAIVADDEDWVEMMAAAAVMARVADTLATPATGPLAVETAMSLT